MRRAISPRRQGYTDQTVTPNRVRGATFEAYLRQFSEGLFWALAQHRLAADLGFTLLVSTHGR